MAKNNFDIDAIIERGITNLDTNTSTQPTGQETWTEYGVRNLAKLPAQAYKLARSGLGVGNLAELGARKLGAPQAIKTGLEYALPTSGQAEKEIESGYKKIVDPETAKYLSESRPEDWGAEFLTTEIPFIVASGGLGSLKSLGRAAASSAGLLGGSIGGQKVGGAIGEYLGDREIGEALGGIAGGVAGVKGTHRGFNLPSSTIGKKVEPAERAKFEKNRLQKLSELKKEYGPKIKQMSEAELGAALQGAREKDLFNKTKTDRIKSIKDEIKGYDKKIEDLQSQFKFDYEQARKLESGAAKPSNLLKEVRDIKKSLSEGILPADRKFINSLTDGLNETIRNNKGELPIKSAKAFKENLNAYTFDKNLSIPVKRKIQELNDHFREFIREEAEPAHKEFYGRADEAKREYHKLEEGRDKFVESRNEAIKEINQQKIPAEREALLKHEYGKIKEALHATNKEYNDSIKALGKDSYENLIKSKNAQEKLIEQVAGAAVQGANKTGLAGMVGILSGLKFSSFTKGGLSALATSFASRFYDEVTLAKRVMNEHPELYKEYADIIKNADKWNTDRVTLSLNALGKKIEDYDEDRGTARAIDLSALGLENLGKL